MYPCECVPHAGRYLGQKRALILGIELRPSGRQHILLSTESLVLGIFGWSKEKKASIKAQLFCFHHSTKPWDVAFESNYLTEWFSKWEKRTDRTALSPEGKLPRNAQLSSNPSPASPHTSWGRLSQCCSEKGRPTCAQTSLDRLFAYDSISLSVTSLYEKKWFIKIISQKEMGL